MRPIGGWLIGRIADRHGRRIALILTVSAMCLGSLMLACLPTYATIGAWAPALLLLARLIQGLSVGGEFGTAATYVSEVATKGHRGFYSAFQIVTMTAGQLGAVLVLVVLQQVLTEAELKAWGWRIPFVIGAVAAVAAVWVRRRIQETSTAKTRANRDAGSVAELFRNHKAAFFTVFGYTAGGSLVFYTFTTYMQKYLVNSTGLSIKTASNVMTGCLFVFMCIQPALGALSDRIGRRGNMMIFGALGALGTVPVLTALQGAQSALQAFFLISSALLVISFYTSASAVLKAEMFPAELRAVGVGLSYGVANALFGGSAEYVALSLKSIGQETLFYWYVTVMLVVTFLVSLRLPRVPTYLRDGL
jgi:MHS family alpha-ketoglutarate permease-like MFS transporter